MELPDLQINTTKKRVNHLKRYICNDILVFPLALFVWLTISSNDQEKNLDVLLVVHHIDIVYSNDDLINI